MSSRGTFRYHRPAKQDADRSKRLTGVERSRVWGYKRNTGPWSNFMVEVMPILYILWGDIVRYRDHRFIVIEIEILKTERKVF